MTPMNNAEYLTRLQNADKLEALKQEAERTAKEQERANAIHDSVNNLPIDDVRERLQNVARK